MAPGTLKADDRGDVLVLFGSKISRDTAVYAAGTAIVLPFSLVTVAVLTRFLDPAEYGQVAVLFVCASLLTTVYDLGSLQGTLMWVFGGAGEDVDLDAEAGADGRDQAQRSRDRLGADGRDRGRGHRAARAGSRAHRAAAPGRLRPRERRALGRGVRGPRFGAAAGCKRVRMERRRRRSRLNALRPSLSCSRCRCRSWSTAAGRGGDRWGRHRDSTSTGLLVCLVIGRRSYVPGSPPTDARGTKSWSVAAVRDRDRRSVGRAQRRRAPALALRVRGPGGALPLAGRVAAFVSYFVSAFLMAWAPLGAIAGACHLRTRRAAGRGGAGLSRITSFPR